MSSLDMFESQESGVLEPEPEKSKTADTEEKDDFSQNLLEDVTSEPSESMESDVNNVEKEVEGDKESEQVTSEPTDEKEPDDANEEVDDDDVPMDSEDLDDPAVLSEVQNTMESGESQSQEEAPEKLFQFPLGTIKRIMKLDPDLNMTNQDAIFLISKATEMFIESLTRESYGYTAKSKKKTIQKNDITTAIETTEILAFLDGAMED